MPRKAVLQNAKIRTKIITAFGLIILVAALIICWLLAEMSGIAKSTQALYDEPFAESNYTWTIRRNLLDTERVLYRLATIEDMSVMDKAISSASATPVSYTHLDVYKRQP